MATLVASSSVFVAPAARISGVNTSCGPSNVKAPSTPNCSNRRAWAGASLSPASMVSNFTRASNRRPACLLDQPTLVWHRRAAPETLLVRVGRAQPIELELEGFPWPAMDGECRHHCAGEDEAAGQKQRLMEPRPKGVVGGIHDLRGDFRDSR